MLYDSKNVQLCRIEKPHNFLQFTYIGYGNEREHLNEIEERDREWLVNEVKRLTEEEHLDQRAIGNRLGISASTVGRMLKE